MARCLVLGGNGLIGSFVAERLVSAGHAVRVFDLFSGSDNLRGVAGKIGKVKADYVAGGAALKSAVEGIDVVFHCIHTTLPGSSVKDPVFDAETNILPSVRLLEHSVGAGVKKFVYLSSIAVYGEPRSIPIKETAEPAPVSPYGFSKLAIERYVRFFGARHGLDFALIRPSATYGERQKVSPESGVVANFVFSAVTGRPITIFGDGSAVRDLTHAEDIASGVVAAAFKKTKSKVFNLGTGRGITLKALAAKVEKVCGVKLEMRYAPNAGAVQRHVYDVSLARKQLGWKAMVSLDDGIIRCFESFRRKINEGQN